jgi:hypothetical protein
MALTRIQPSALDKTLNQEVQVTTLTFNHLVLVVLEELYELYGVLIEHSLTPTFQQSIHNTLHKYPQ